MTGPSSSPRGEHTPAPGATWEQHLVRTEQLVDDDAPDPRHPPRPRPRRTEEDMTNRYEEASEAARGLLADFDEIDLAEIAATTAKERDGAYRERAHLVALLAAMTPGAVITYATDVDEPGWQIVYLTIGGRQASWHISPRDGELFAHLEAVEADDPRAQWNGHTTEEKYEGIATHTVELMQQCGPECSEMHRGGSRCAAGRN